MRIFVVVVVVVYEKNRCRTTVSAASDDSTTAVAGSVDDAPDVPGVGYGPRVVLMYGVVSSDASTTVIRQPRKR